jgi:hypothetical protein
LFLASPMPMIAKLLFGLVHLLPVLCMHHQHVNRSLGCRPHLMRSRETLGYCDPCKCRTVHHESRKCVCVSFRENS